MGKATQDLRREHDTILRAFKILDKMMALDSKDESFKLNYYKELVYFLNMFVDKCHNQKEEIYLFAELVDKGVLKEDGLIETLLEEHNQAREYEIEMNKCLVEEDTKEFINAVLKYRDLLESHIEKENNELFVEVDLLFDGEKQDQLFEIFEHYEDSVIGEGIHEELHSMIHKWEKECEM